MNINKTLFLLLGLMLYAVSSEACTNFIVGLIALRLKKFDFGTICGILCGSMANPMALGYANDTVKDTTDSSEVKLLQSQGY